jgi:CsoR family transcriptional regulator, copper-sensing transcriptional repressor
MDNLDPRLAALGDAWSAATLPRMTDQDETATAARTGTDAAEHPPDEQHEDRADRLAERIALPVLIAALASVPAVFLTLFDDPYQTVGEGLNTLSGGVLIAETVVLFAVAENRWEWVKRNKWLVLLALAIIPAVVFAIGPVQLLRLLRVAGALRIIRVGRILKAGRIVRERAGLTKTWERVIGVAATLLCAAFVAVVLADPTSAIWNLGDPGSEERQAIEGVIARLGWLGALIAGVILFAATYVVWTNRKRGTNDEDAEDDTEA